MGGGNGSEGRRKGGVDRPSEVEETKGGSGRVGTNQGAFGWKGKRGWR